MTINKNPSIAAKRYLKFSFLFFLIPLFIDFMNLVITGEYQGDLSTWHIQKRISNFEVIAIFLYYIVCLSIGYFLVLRLLKSKFVIDHEIHCIPVRKRLEVLLLILSFYRLYSAVKFGVGKAGGYSSSSIFTLIGNMLSFDTIYFMYYVAFRSKPNKTFWLLIIIYTLTQFLQGWSGFVYTIFCLEVFNLFQNKRKMYLLYIGIPIVFLAGGMLYKIIYPYKMLFRLMEKNATITYFEALVHVCTRMSSFSNSCYSFENAIGLLELNAEYNTDLGEVLYFFNSITPSSLYDKSFKPINMCFIKYITGEFGGNFDLGCSYPYFLLKISPFVSIFYWFILIINRILQLMFVSFLGSRKYAYYYCIGFFSIFAQPPYLNLESLWITSIFCFLFFWLLGGFKIYRKRVSYGISY